MKNLKYILYTVWTIIIAAVGFIFLGKFLKDDKKLTAKIKAQKKQVKSKVKKYEKKLNTHKRNFNSLG